MPFSEGAPVDCRRGLGESGIDCFLAGDIRANEQVEFLHSKFSVLSKIMFMLLVEFPFVRNHC